MKAQLIIGVALVLMLFALPALAEPAGRAPDLLTPIFAAPDGTCALPMASKTGGPPGVESFSGCTASCANAGGGSVSCTSSTGDFYCFNNCYAYCDGQYHFCPHPPRPCPI